MPQQTAPDLVERIRPPEEVRARLGENLRENRLLQSLLRLSLKAAEERNRREESEEATIR